MSSWTYDPALIATSTLYQVRRLIGDVLTNDPQLQDEEIAFAITQRATIYGAAADCCRQIAAGYSRRAASVSVQGMSLTYSNQATTYLRMATEFESLATARGAALPYAGGISIADKAAQEADADRVGPQFALGMTDNLTVPGGPVETPETQQ